MLPLFASDPLRDIFCEKTDEEGSFQWLLFLAVCTVYCGGNPEINRDWECSGSLLNWLTEALVWTDERAWKCFLWYSHLQTHLQIFKPTLLPSVYWIFKCVNNLKYIGCNILHNKACCCFLLCCGTLCLFKYKYKTVYPAQTERDIATFILMLDGRRYDAPQSKNNSPRLSR